jgi:hypothetical protein
VAPQAAHGTAPLAALTVPEYPDVTVGAERSEERLPGQALRQVQLLPPFVWRSPQSVSRFAPFSSQAYTALRSAAMAS